METPAQTDEIRQYWDEAAADYDSYPDHGLLDSDTRGAWKDLLRTWLPTRPGRVADLGCGTGTLSVLLAELGHEVCAVDLSGEMVARARAKTAPFGAAVEVVEGDAADPPFEPGTFDGVLARHVLWALPDPTAALTRWAELLRPGGRLVLVEGRWGTPDPDPGPSRAWRAGVPSEELAAAVRDLVGPATVVPLGDARYWGREVDDERYLLTATSTAPVPS